MTEHATGTREEWLARRLELLAAEKDVTWRGDELDWATYARERPDMSGFAVEDGVVYHTYSAYARGLDGLWGMYQWFNRAPRGRNEMRGTHDPLNWFRRHDEYNQ